MKTVRNGQQLMRTFENGVKAIMEKRNGTTCSQIYIPQGKIFTKRITLPVEQKEVGDKFVRRKVSISNSHYTEEPMIIKEIKDLVYNKNGQYLGERIQWYTYTNTSNPELIGRGASLKTNERQLSKCFNKDGIRSETAFYTNGGPYGADAFVFHNNLGLPIPQSYKRGAIELNGKSLKEMQAMHSVKAPHLTYQVPGAKMSYLDFRVSEAPTSNNIQKFI